MTRAFVFFLFALILFSSCRKKKWKCDEEVSYKNDIKPFIDSRCNKCHKFDTYPAVRQLATSGKLKEVTITTDKMPPAGEKRLTRKERQKIYCWIEAGAPDN
jgi:uncharacterized membrane protein